MKARAETLINKFLRTYRELFSEKLFMRFLARTGIRASREECEQYLLMNANVFPLEDGLFITRAGAFTNQYFSFKPTRAEVEQGVFVAGGRCMPFVDVEMLPSELTFIFQGEPLTHKTAEFDNGTAGDLFALYGIEFSSQYIAADPANAGLDLAALDFELPSKVKLTCNSLEPLIKECGFKLGDRILCRVVDWDAGQIEIAPINRDKNSMQMRTDDFARQNWYDNLERFLLESFETTGPCSSIEEQLAFIFLDEYETLCTPDCGSVEEFLMQSRRVNYEPFGVETRLWRSGEEVPAVGKWNELPHGEEPSDGEERFLHEFAVTDFTIDAYVKDQLFEKKWEPEKIVEQFLPEGIPLTDKEKRFLLLQVNARHDIINKSYNWFADFSIGPLRRRALALYRKAGNLVFEIDRYAVDLEKYPQQCLVILSQILSHVQHILEMLEYDDGKVDLNEIALSIEGMECNFEGISDELLDAVESEKRRGFSVVK